VDLIILTALKVTSRQNNSNQQKTMKRVEQLLDYMHTNPKAAIQFSASDMVLNLHSDASYLSAAQGRSRLGGYFFLESMPKDGKPIFLNGNMAVTCAIIKIVTDAAAEADAEAGISALFINAKEAKPIQIIISE